VWRQTAIGKWKSSPIERSRSVTVDQPAARLDRARAAAFDVRDPELPFLSIAEMGILREVRLAADGETIEAVITPTYSGCPAMDMIRLDVELALAKAEASPSRVVSVLLPAWTTDWLTEEAKSKLRANGIAPPPKASGKRALFADEVVACPKCGSGYTRKVADFSSTACKAHWSCLACREPFEYFKCI
jgi:ring-1,2-phenylacetyl-CoA epoxidase subunit PaaD